MKDPQQEIRDRDKEIEKLKASSKKMDKLFWDLVDDREDVKTLYQNEHKMADELARELRLSTATTTCKCGGEYTCGLCKVLNKHTDIRYEEKKANRIKNPETEGCDIL